MYSAAAHSPLTAFGTAVGSLAPASHLPHPQRWPPCTKAPMMNAYEQLMDVDGYEQTRERCMRCFAPHTSRAVAMKGLWGVEVAG